MAEIDIVILAIVAWAGFQGWRHGLLKEIVSLMGFFVGLFIAYHLYDAFGAYLAPNISSNATIGKYLGYLLAFIILWVVVPILMGVLANILTKSFKGLHLGGINSFLGLLVGIAKYLILLSFVFCAMDFLGILNKTKKEQAIFYNPVASIVKAFVSSDKMQFKSHAKEDSTQVKQDTVWIDVSHKKK